MFKIEYIENRDPESENIVRLTDCRFQDTVEQLRSELTNCSAVYVDCVYALAQVVLVGSVASALHALPTMVTLYIPNGSTPPHKATSLEHRRQSQSFLRAAQRHSDTGHV